MNILSSADFFKVNFLKEFFQEHYQSVKRFGSRSESKLYANIISRRQSLLLGFKPLTDMITRSKIKKKIGFGVTLDKLTARMIFLKKYVL